jgi:two-component sensor histidine kinase
LRIALQPLAGSREIRLSVADNGVGLPPDFSLEHLTSLGLPVALGLARQLGGKLEIGAGPDTMFELTFTSYHAGLPRNDRVSPLIL